MAQFIGFSFPFRKGATSFPEVATDDALIKQALIQLVLTGTGERVMRPDYGSSAYSYIFEPNEEILQQRIETELSALILKYEPRVAVTSIEVVRGNQNLDSEASTITITINYVVIATRTSGEAEISLSPGGGT